MFIYAWTSYAIGNADIDIKYAILAENKMQNSVSYIHDLFWFNEVSSFKMISFCQALFILHLFHYHNAELYVRFDRY